MPDALMIRRRKMSLAWLTVAALAAIPLIVTPATAQFGRGGGRGGPPPVPRAAAPVDLTGYWVSIVTEDWIERMAPDSPPSGTGGGRGGFGGGGGGAQPASNPDDPCRVYGAAGSLRVPGRLYVSWVDDSTLQIETDAGTQTRVLHFNPTEPAPAESSLQGYSVATWQTGGGGGRGRGRGGGGGAPPAWGNLEVVTTNLTGGYLLTSRSNYSDNTVLTENFMAHSDFGVDYLTVQAIVEDGGSTRITSSTFKKEADDSNFSPSGCEVFR